MRWKAEEKFVGWIKGRETGGDWQSPNTLTVWVYLFIERTKMTIFKQSSWSISSFIKPGGWRCIRFSLGFPFWKFVALWNLEPKTPSEMISDHSYLFLLPISTNHPELTTLHITSASARAIDSVICPGWVTFYPRLTSLVTLGIPIPALLFPIHSPSSLTTYLGWLPCFIPFGSNNKNPVLRSKFISVEQVGYSLHIYGCG